MKKRKKSFMKKKFMKKQLFAGLALLSVTPFLFGFTDLPDEHWAAQSVNRLVSDGTVGGYGDDTFRPNQSVTRAEFVKMLGYRSALRGEFMPDLSARHWAYVLLKHSPLRTVDGNMLPDEPITRLQVAQYLYDCYANGSDAEPVPFVINRQSGDSQKEVAWVYNRGIMVGDDGITLRLSDPLTRAEAAVLIVNSRSRLGSSSAFEDCIPQERLERVFTASGLFDSAYEPDKVLTNGEAARAAYRLRLDRVQGLYYENEADFEHEYANDLKAMEPILGSGRISAAFADASAMPEDTYSMFAFAMAAKARSETGYGSLDKYFADAQLAAPSQNAPLTMLFENGITPFAKGTIKSGTPVTHRDIAAVLLLLDMRWGLQSSATVEGDSVTYNDEPMRYENLPANEADFHGILESVPNEVYEMPYVADFAADGTPERYADEGEVGLPVENYTFYYYLMDAFADELANRAAQLAEKGVTVRYTYYPQLTYDDGNAFVIRVKAEVTGTTAAVTEKELTGSGDASTVSAGYTWWPEYELPYLFFMGG